jgi:hypothetical protein
MEIRMMSRELMSLSWAGAVKVVEGAGQVVVKEKVEVDAELAGNFRNEVEEE